MLRCLQFPVFCSAGMALIEINLVESGHHVPYVRGVVDRWRVVFQDGKLLTANRAFLLDQLRHEGNLCNAPL